MDRPLAVPALFAGFTLIEMLIALVIVAILLTAASPPLAAWLQDNRLVAQINRLNGTLQLARTEAIKRGATVTVCSSSNGASCGGLWKDGWIILAGATLIQTYGALSADTTLHYTLAAGTPASTLLFDSRGFSTDYAGTWSLCDSRGSAHARGLVMTGSGRVVKARDVTMNGIPEDGQGNDLSCP
ncbi:MAG: GspH/FimT family pseudopilin [Magnetococcus sp. MYC-9]